jgi:acetoin:2,6-dichlorophenolindophenol oxidoreductase subunit beta
MSAAAPKIQKINMVQGLNMALAEALEADPSVIVFGEDIADPQGGGVLKVTQGLSTRFGAGRVRSTPIAEQAIVGAAVGAALAGLRPVAEIMLMNFMAVAMDQIVNHAAKLRFMSGGQTSVPLTIRTMSGAGWGLGGQHSDMLEAWFCHTAGLKVVAPSSPAEAKGLLLASIFDDDPVIFVESLPQYYTEGPAPQPGYRIPLGKADVARTGSDISVIAYGRTVADVHVVAEKLSREHISVEVIDLRTISPLDEETVLKSVAKTRRAVVVHEAVTRFGVGAEISSRIHEELFGDLKHPVQRVGSEFCPVPFSNPLETAFLYSAQKIEAAIRKTLDGKSR